MPRAVTIGYADMRIIVDTSVCFAPGGNVNLWFQRRRNDIERVAHDFAPPNRTEARWGTWSRGNLQRSFYSHNTQGARTIDFVVGNSAPYARYVHDGTALQGKGYIYTDAGFAQKSVVNKWIKLKQFTASADEAGFYMPVTRIPFKTKFMLRVHGQKANPFLSDAYNLVARRTKGGLPVQKFKHTGFG